MGFVAEDEASSWLGWLTQLAGQSRVYRKNDRWFAVDGPTDDKKVLLGRLEALGPVVQDDPRISLNGQTSALLPELEHEGAILRTRLEGRSVWCERRLLARIQRYTLDTLRRAIEPVSAAEFLSFLACWQHVDEGHRLDGPRGVAEILRQLAGFEAPAWAWESTLLPLRVRDYRREWLDELTLSGEFAWGRLWGAARNPPRVMPLSFIPRQDLETWLRLAEPPPVGVLNGPAADLLEAFNGRGAMFTQDLQKAAGLVPAHVEMGLADLMSHGLVTCDSFAALRQLITPPSRRRGRVHSVGRWSHFRMASAPEAAGAAGDEFAAMQLLQRTGIVFRRVITREKLPVSWSALFRVYRRMELRGEVRGGRFVAGFSGEQFGLPRAVEQLRQLRRTGPRPTVSVSSADPLNLQGILTPQERISSTARRQVLVG
jgi:ATP-dependent Lhr-like helicase